MAATVLTLRQEPDQRLDLSAVTPERLRDLSRHEIGALPVGTTRVPIALGDIFAIRLGDRDRIRIVGGSKRLDRIGAALKAGEIRVEGDVGQAGDEAERQAADDEHDRIRDLELPRHPHQQHDGDQQNDDELDLPHVEGEPTKR